MYKIAIAGASTLLGRELKDALSDSPLAAANFVLLDEEEAQGQLDQVGDEVTFVQAIDARCRSSGRTLRFLRHRDADAQALAAGAAGGVDGAGSVRRAGPGDRCAGARAVAGIGWRRRPTCLRPRWFRRTRRRWRWRWCWSGCNRLRRSGLRRPRCWSRRAQFGRAAMDELHQQTVSLLSFQGLPRAIYDAQAAYNLLGGLGESATISLGAEEARIRRHYEALGDGRWPALALQVIHAPVFHGHAFSIAVELERPVEISALEEALSGEHVDLVLEDTDSPSNLAATGQNDVLVRLRPEKDGRNPNVTSRLWLWAASDNLRLHAQNAVECALDLRRLRPAGTVQ